MEFLTDDPTSPRPPPTRRLLTVLRAWAVAWMLIRLPCAALPLHAADPVSKEYQVKAAFLYNFAKFVEWPAQRFEQANSPIIIGIFGENPFGVEIERLTEGRTINGRPIVVRSVQSANAVRNVHLVFFSAGAEGRFADLRESLRAAGTLTVGETDGFARHGGMINFVPEGDKLRFELNVGEASGAGLRISAQLQKLARRVHR